MANRLVLQPNKLFARFSDIVDNFTHMNMTRDEAFEVVRDDMGRSVAEQKIARAERDEGEDGASGDGLSRWRNALDTIEAIHGKGQRDKSERIGVASP